MLGQTTLSRSIQIQIRDESNREKTITAIGPKFMIGRDATCQFRPRDMLASRQHAEIFWEGDQILLRDLNSRNGTLLNEDRVYFPTPLQDGDVVTIGKHILTIRMEEPSAETGAISEDDVASWLENAPRSAAAQAPGANERPSETHVRTPKSNH